MKRKIFAVALIMLSIGVMIFPTSVNLPENVLYLFCAIILACGIVIWMSVATSERMDYLRTRLRNAEGVAIEKDIRNKKLESLCRNYERIIGNSTEQHVKLKNQIIAYKLNYARLKKQINGDKKH